MSPAELRDMITRDRKHAFDHEVERSTRWSHARRAKYDARSKPPVAKVPVCEPQGPKGAK